MWMIARFPREISDREPLMIFIGNTDRNQLISSARVFRLLAVICIEAAPGNASTKDGDELRPLDAATSTTVERFSGSGTEPVHEQQPQVSCSMDKYYPTKKLFPNHITD